MRVIVQYNVAVAVASLAQSEGHTRCLLYQSGSAITALMHMRDAC